MDFVASLLHEACDRPKLGRSQEGRMRMSAFVALSLALGLGACSVLGVASDAVSVTGTVVSTAARATVAAAGAAARTVSGSSSDEDKKAE
jgi:hypothetical protein